MANASSPKPHITPMVQYADLHLFQMDSSTPSILILTVKPASSPERGSNKRLKVARRYSPGRVYDDVVTLLKIEIYEEDTREESKVHM
ncbi:uncharacterized protein STEHIDRAFT_157524 [Stereum hirsutum FP-91666 SS1]|uniref:uncharacterized protein n=1 Tax=Stereum hirsutum (strain FP-91666) TaxID=721885 RepID=UPI000444A059|nr:uncharacterized protein STEHIDRAFT_157524 [Stereum hirsutum FP-91666 SS1]EIM85998.1 hypothetical protein STEHIDRAFT_157524 [Stereum hirsutum FP-91666 SS1]